MDTIISRDTIKQAMDELAYRNKKSPKYLLLEAIARRYPEDTSLPLEKEIPSDDLVKELWETGGDPLTIANRRKNFNSIKSSINSDLKQLYTEGKNPSGIVIGPENSFIMSDEAREDLLASLARTAGDGSLSALDQLAKMMGLLKDLLADNEIIDPNNPDDALSQIYRMLQTISEKLGMEQDDSGKKTEGLDHSSMEGTEPEKELNEGIEPENDRGEGESNLSGETGDSDAQAGEGVEEVEMQGEEYLDDSGLEILDDDEEIEIVDDPDDSEILEDIEEDVSEILTDFLDGQGEIEDEDFEIVELEPDDDLEDVDVDDDNEEDLEEELQEDGEGLYEGDTGSDEFAQDAIEETIDDDDDLEIVELGPDDDLEDVDIVDDEDLEEEIQEDEEEGLDEGDTGGEDELGEDVIEETLDDDDDLEIVELGPDDDLEDVDIVDDEDLEEEIQEDEEEGLDEGDTGGEDELGEDVIEETLDDDDDLEIVELGPDDDLEDVDVVDDEGMEDELEDIEEVEGDLKEIDAGLENLDEDLEELEGYQDEIDTALEDEILDDDLEKVEEVFEEAGGDLEGEEILEDDEDLEEIEEVDADAVGEDEESGMSDDGDKEGEPGNEEEFEEVGLLDDDEELEILDDDQEMEEVEEEPEQAFSEPSMGALGADAALEEEPDKARVLAEQFDGFLGSMEKHYNQYLLIPEGSYMVGSKSPGKGERSLQAVDIQPFYIGKYPVTNALFEIFVEKTGYVTTAEERGYGMVYTGRYEKITDPRTGKSYVKYSQSRSSRKMEGANWFQPQGLGSTLHRKRNHPVVQVSRRDAIAFAAWTGKKLPSENEWESAARTGKGLVYPWGNEWNQDLANTEESKIGDTCPVEFFHNANSLNISDTVGNVLEWTTDLADPSKPDIFIVKGASWVSTSPAPLYGRTLCRSSETSNILGFRCVAI
ncbi:MAG: SUMF1/EgtB/PvdO family nonheme iron enzyme [Desulfatibacillum sp.]|nr:SUMF1/EgtB/PvdO family nonheme iron enzyme [Desulfatibacillum sp.]